MMPWVGAYTGSIVGSSSARNRHHMYAGFLGRQPDFVVDFATNTDFAAMADASIPEGWRKFNQKRLMLTMPLIPNKVTTGGADATLAAAAAGDYNSNYTNLMINYQKAGYQDIIVRLGHEFNGTWYKWRADNGNEALYVAAFRNAVTAIRNSPNAGGSGVQFRFDWCPTWAAVPNQPSDCDVEACYPGDDVVDVIGLDVYNQHFPAIEDPVERWESIVNGTHGLKWHAEFAAAHGKPISFPEWGTGVRVPDPDGNGGGDDPVFVRNMAAWIESHPVLYHSYWDVQADLDTRLSDYIYPMATQAYRAAFRAL